MKKLFAFLLVVVMILSMMVGCGNNTTPGNDTDTKKIETLKVAFVPSREPAEIITVTEPLKAMLKEELAKEGYEVGEVEITVGTTYEAVGEGLEAGTIDVGLIPGGTYVLYDDGSRSSSLPPVTASARIPITPRIGTMASPPKLPKSRLFPIVLS
ncbi:MAG: PhnD/SsuA/transferrin family substrate-binding protein [Angelakisella sp.]